MDRELNDCELEAICAGKQASNNFAARRKATMASSSAAPARAWEFNSPRSSATPKSGGACVNGKCG